MKKSNIFIVIIALVTLAVPLACKKKFLDQTNTFQGSADATFTKASDVVALVNASL